MDYQEGALTRLSNQVRALAHECHYADDGRHSDLNGYNVASRQLHAVAQVLIWAEESIRCGRLGKSGEGFYFDYTVSPEDRPALEGFTLQELVVEMTWRRRMLPALAGYSLPELRAELDSRG